MATIEFNKECNYVTFPKLDNQNIINLYTTKPFNFRTCLVSDKEIKQYYIDIQNSINNNFTKIIKPNQNHTNIVKVVTEENINEVFEDVDGLITNLKNIALVTSLADCQGILLYDKEKQVIGNIHSGWKGTLNKIIINAINLMISTYNSNPENIEVYITPSIENCCFEVDDDVKNLFINNFKELDIKKFITLGEIKDNKQKYFIDTIGINKSIMLTKGIKGENITLSNLCTKCHSKYFHSHRSEGINSGRNIALICLK